MDSGTRRRLQRDVVLPMSADRASARLVQLFALQTGRRRVELTVGPGRNGRLVTSRVAGVVSGPDHRLSTTAFALHWEPLGLARRGLPALDAEFGVTPIDQTACLLSIIGCYDVPFRGVGVVADRAVMGRIADATVSSLLRQWAGAIHGSAPMLPASPVRSVRT